MSPRDLPVVSDLGARRQARLVDARLAVVADTRAGDGDLAGLLTACCGASADLLLLRDATADEGELREAAAVFRRVADDHGALFVLADLPGPGRRRRRRRGAGRPDRGPPRPRTTRGRPRPADRTGGRVAHPGRRRRRRGRRLPRGRPRALPRARAVERARAPHPGGGDSNRCGTPRGTPRAVVRRRRAGRRREPGRAGGRGPAGVGGCLRHRAPRIPRRSSGALRRELASAPA